MSQTRTRLTEDTLFLAFTRPAMFMGVPVNAMVFNMMITGFAYLAGGSLLFLGIGPIVHLVFREVCKRDHNQFGVLFVWMDTKGRARNGGLWGGSSVSPLKLHRRYDKKDME